MLIRLNARRIALDFPSGTQSCGEQQFIYQIAWLAPRCTAGDRTAEARCEDINGQLPRAGAN
jgi:hypothetical protein